MQGASAKPRVYKWVVFREKLNMWDALFVVDKQVAHCLLLTVTLKARSA